MKNLSVIIASLDDTSPDRRGIGSPVRFPSNFNQSQQNDTSLPRAPLPGELARQRLRGWTKDAFRLSGITQVLLCTTSPSSSLTLDATSPSRGGFGIPQGLLLSPEALKSVCGERHLFAKGSPFGGAGASAPERASPVKLLQRRCDTMALTSRVRIAVCLALGQHPCPLRLLRRHLSQSERHWQSGTLSIKLQSISAKRHLFAKGSPVRKDSPGRGRWHASAERGTAGERMRD